MSEITRLLVQAISSSKMNWQILFNGQWSKLGIVLLLIFVPFLCQATMANSIKSSAIEPTYESNIEPLSGTKLETTSETTPKPKLEAISESAIEVTSDETDTSPGVIRFVFGSDSSTPGIHIYTKTANYRNSNFDLFRSPTRQTARIMEPSFRDRYRDSSGEPFRFTWWMQGGSLYRYATNTNLPHPSLMSLYLMNQFHKENMEQYGDEFTYHYHTWIWSDNTGDGTYYWNQTFNYIDSQADFFRNMAEALIEEDMFPVSFRSGWHFMDADWQADLDDWIPFNMHNDWPANRTNSPEPVNNINVWNEAPSEWVPYQPRSDNYMLPGGDRSWNTRSIHFRNVRESHIREIFEAANNGIDQVPCIWSHVAELTFIEDFERVFELIELVAADYPHIEFYYDTAIEAMQQWLGTEDTTPPVLTVDEIPTGDGYRIRVQSDKPLFMTRPFLAAKDMYENHRRVEMSEVGNLIWESNEILTHQNAVSWSVAATDSSGNLAKHHQDWLPRIVYIDDEQSGEESSTFSVLGNWRVADYKEIDAVWGTGAHVADASTDAASAKWETVIADPAHYDVQIRFPSGPEFTEAVPYSVLLNGNQVKSGSIGQINYDRWTQLHDLEMRSGDIVSVEIRREQGQKTALTADAVRITAYRPAVFITTSAEIPNLGFMQKGTSEAFSIIFENMGQESAQITRAESAGGSINAITGFPTTISRRSASELRFEFKSSGYGILRDTLILETTDPANSVFAIPVEAYGKRPFQIVDNSDETGYHENGSWNYSVAQAYGTSSRWIGISEANKDASATYQLTISETTRYALSFIVPGATNSALRALYEVEINGNSVLSRVINQNADRSAWKWLGSLDAYSGDNLEITVSMMDADQPGRVLRADAVQIEELGANRKEKIIDLESDEYVESGTWHTSNSSAWGTFSRYTAAKDASATYDIGHVEAGLAELEILLPNTENAVENARYRAFRAGKVLGESIIDQNVGSGNWAQVGVYPVDIAGDISVMVDYPESGAMNGVLRAGGIRLTYGGDTSSTSVHEEVDAPLQVKLHQNYPNPFNPTTNIRFEIAHSDRRTSLSVFDILGRRVASLVDGLVSAGSHTIPFDGSSLASGVYIYQLQHDGIVLQQKMMLIK